MSVTNYISRVGIWRILFSVLFVLLGAFMFVYGGYDDSPGGQGLGLALVLLGLWRLVRDRRKNA